MAKAVTTTIKDSFFDDPFFKASKQKMIKNDITYTRYTDPSRQFFENLSFLRAAWAGHLSKFMCRKYSY